MKGHLGSTSSFLHSLFCQMLMYVEWTLGEVSISPLRNYHDFFSLLWLYSSFLCIVLYVWVDVRQSCFMPFILQLATHVMHLCSELKRLWGIIKITSTCCFVVLCSLMESWFCFNSSCVIMSLLSSMVALNGRETPVIVWLSKLRYVVGTSQSFIPFYNLVEIESGGTLPPYS